MFIVIVFFILTSVYVGQNKKLSESTKSGWFIFLAIVSLLILILS